MTQDEFLAKYHDYQESVLAWVIEEAEAVNNEGVEGDRAIVVSFGDLGYCLMLEQAARFLGAGAE
jgi:hypothetical protein